jgi:hypothetical protein
MKTNLLRASVLAAVAAAAAYGQSSKTLTVMVPFDFIVGSQTLRAGQYSVDRETFSSAVIINGADQKAIVMATALESIAAQEGGKLVFHRYGNTYFLTEVWGAGNYRLQVPETRQERAEVTAGRLRPDDTILVSAR